MITTLAITFLSTLTLIFSYTTWNLLRKNEKQEDIVAGYLEYLNKISQVIELSDERIKKLDQNEMFSSDDEIGFFFKNIKQLQNIFNEFKIK